MLQRTADSSTFSYPSPTHPWLPRVSRPSLVPFPDTAAGRCAECCQMLSHRLRPSIPRILPEFARRIQRVWPVYIDTRKAAANKKRKLENHGTVPRFSPL